MQAMRYFLTKQTLPHPRFRDINGYKVMLPRGCLHELGGTVAPGKNILMTLKIVVHSVE